MFDKEMLDQIVKSYINSESAVLLSKVNIEKRLKAYLTEKVNKSGDTSYSSFGGGHPDTPRIVYLIDQQIKDIFEKAIANHALENKDQLREQAMILLSGENGIASAMTDIFLKHISQPHRVKIQVK